MNPTSNSTDNLDPIMEQELNEMADTPSYTLDIVWDNNQTANVSTAKVTVTTDLELPAEFGFAVQIAHRPESFEITVLTSGGKGHPKLTGSTFLTLEEAQDAVSDTINESVNNIIENVEAGIRREKEAPIRAQELADFLTEMKFPYVVNMNVTAPHQPCILSVWIEATDEECNYSDEYGQANLYCVLMEIAGKEKLNLNNYRFLNGPKELFQEGLQGIRQQAVLASIFTGQPVELHEITLQYTPSEEDVKLYDDARAKSAKKFEEELLKEAVDPKGFQTGGVIENDGVDPLVVKSDALETQ